MKTPLADRVRPTDIANVVGQHHLLDDGKILRRIIESGEIPNLIFYGPSGVGKTTVANIIAKKSGKTLYRLNATTASTSDLKEIIASRSDLENQNGILLYLDEIQYFNKKQQQTLLEYIENGDITLIASTTENPYFYVYNAILSRSTVFEFKPLNPEDIEVFISRAFNTLAEENEAELHLDSDVLKIISYGSGGDLRKALNSTELCFLTGEREFTEGKTIITISNETADALTEQSGMRYDREGDDHYDVISAYQKSMRGSDPDAALHYLARLLAAGDLQSACRRLLVTACEDVGLAHPNIIPIVKACVDSALMLGLPEARLPLADAVILVSISPKSNSGHDAIAAAMADVEKGIATSVPRQLQNKHFDGEDATVKGQFYKYPHSFPNHYVAQQYLPDEIKNRTYYEYGSNKNEQSYKKYWDEIKK
ncbi:MAG: replication-associated recombination protein A [Ruminococcaceae bacterium]|nr:replication-associated recombination protein A [Oscillospiraceae bacterium]